MTIDSIVVTREYENRKGGLGTYTDMLMEYLNKRFGKVCVIEIPKENKGYYSARLEGEEVVVFNIPFPREDMRSNDEYDYYMSKILEEVRIKNNCILFGNDWYGGFVVETLRNKITKKTKHVFVLHIFSSMVRLNGYNGDKFENLVEKKGYPPHQEMTHEIERDIVSKSDSMIFISEHMKRFTKDKLGVPSAGEVINHYVEYPPMTKVSYSDELQDIVFAGRFADQKGVLDLAEHMEEILKVAPKSRFHFYGKGDRRPILEWATRRFGDRVEIHGFVPREELLCILPDMDLLVMPSIFEPFGFSALEAMAAGVPIAATDTGGLGELTSWLPDGLRFQRSFGTNSLYTSPENIGAYIPRQELLRVFQFAANNPEVLRQVGREGRRIAAEQYTRQRFEREMDEFLSSINALPPESA